MLTTLPPSCAVVMKSGNLNFLEPSGPLQACNGTACTLFIFLQSAWDYLFWSLFLFLSLCSCILIIIFALASIEFGYFATDVFSTALGIRLSFVETLEFRGGV
jgi:hypothetical protein